MSGIVNSTNIVKLIDMHYKHDEENFIAYARLLAEGFDKAGDSHGAEMILDRIAGDVHVA